jgi:general secretion pathway protein G
MAMAKRGFTLVEILIVVTLIGILVAIMIPQYKYSVLRAKEAVLKENLFQMRDAINKYFFDKKKYPESLEDLVAARYLREVPFDPIAGRREWRLVMIEPLEDEELDPEEARGVIDVKSLSEATALDGTSYGEW